MSSTNPGHASLVAVDGRDALAYIIIRPGSQPGAVSIESGSQGLEKAVAAEVLRRVADEWGSLPEDQATRQVLAEIADERRRQDDKFGEQNHPAGTGQHPETVDADVARMACQQAAEGGYLDWMHILREEVAEAFAESDPARLRAELVQVAAVATAWIESLDRRPTGTTP
ncbi:NUDIX hydrolase [Streptomyces sp. NPDC088124]|uniref:NUDIX hydrolase n=1 Tax=Streptomyces sp. NPDC088124 TaxID=3154654 RepID=UPI00342E09BB